MEIVLCFLCYGLIETVGHPRLAPSGRDGRETGLLETCAADHKSRRRRSMRGLRPQLNKLYR